MIVQVFSIYDVTAESYLQPFYAHNRGSAIRMVANAADDTQSNFCKFPNEYILYHIGSFNDETAVVDSIHPERIGTILELSNRS